MSDKLYDCRACGRQLDLMEDRVWNHAAGGFACSLEHAKQIPADQRHLPPLVAFTGAAGSGKTTAAKALLELGYRTHNFAGPIKSAMVALGVPADALTPEGKSLPLDLLCGHTPREAMQTLGTEWGRNMVGEDLWLRAWEATRPAGVLTVIDDLRFMNEAAFLRSRNALIIRIARPYQETVKGGIVDHQSEREMRGIATDDTIFNVGDLRTYGIVVREGVESYAVR